MFAIAACGGQVRASGVDGADCSTPASVSNTCKSDRRVELAWLPDGSRLVVDGRWVFNPETGGYAALPCPVNEAAGCRLEGMSFSPDNSAFVIMKAEQFATGSFGRQVGSWRSIPRWLPREKKAQSDVVNVAFWISTRTLFVQQFYADGHAEPTCRLRDAATGGWMLVRGGCLRPDFSYLAGVDVGPERLLAIHSSAEGRHALSIARYDVQRGQSDVWPAPLILEGASTVRVRFAPDGSRVDLISPCPLSGAPIPPCENPESEPHWKLYSVPISGGAARLVRNDLPPGIAVDPTRDRFAWPKDGAVCVGDPGGSNIKCAAVPR